MYGFLNREVTVAECHWLEENLPQGKKFFQVTGPTYGCIGPKGVAVSEQADQHPFFEVPIDAVTWQN